MVNSTKSLWEPTQLLVWLGFNWNLASGSISIDFYYSITDRHISNFIALIDKFLQSAPYVPARDCASQSTGIMSMPPVFGSLTRLNTCFLYKVIDSILASISGFIMIAFQKYFSEKTILLVLILDLKCVIRRLFYLAFQMLVM